MYSLRTAHNKIGLATMNRIPDDKTLIKSIQNGNKNDFAHLVSKYKQKVFQTCMGFVHNTDDAADLTQDVFIKVFEKLNSFKGTSAFSTWLYRITLNMAINYTRKKRITSMFNFDQKTDELYKKQSSNKTDDRIIQHENKMHVKKMLDKLPLTQRKAFVLSHYREMSNNELADVLNISAKAAESLLFRARKNLQKELKKIES